MIAVYKVLSNNNNSDKSNRNLNVALYEEIVLSFIPFSNIRSVLFLSYDMQLYLLFYCLKFQ